MFFFYGLFRKAQEEKRMEEAARPKTPEELESQEILNKMIMDQATSFPLGIFSVRPDTFDVQY